jgi:hypothetical protein
MPLSELANGSGISRASLANWTKKKPKNKFRKLKATPMAARPSPIKIVLLSGVSIECADFALIKSILEQCA